MSRKNRKRAQGQTATAEQPEVRKCNFDDNPAVPGDVMCQDCRAQYQRLKGYPVNMDAPSTPGAEYR